MTVYYKTIYAENDYFISKWDVKNEYGLIICSHVKGYYPHLMEGSKLSGRPRNYGIRRQRILKSDAQIEVMLG